MRSRSTYMSQAISCFATLLLLRGAAAVAEPPLVCQGTQQSEFTRSSSVAIVQSMRSQLDGCQLVIGDLHIMNIRQQDFIAENKTFSLDFLDSIQEVTGCVRVINSCFNASVIFRSLRVIRGANCDNAVSIIYPSHCQFPQPEAIFSRLAYIANGNFTVTGVNSCYLERSVNYTELFRDPSRQRLIKSIHCVRAGYCHPDCPTWPSGRRHCWGPGPDQCQLQTRCASLTVRQCPSGRCHLDAGSERCCAEQCAGGCYGTAASQCLACASFNKSGVCVGVCNPESIYDPSSAYFVRPSEPKHYPLGPVCVSRCPRTYYTQEGACVSRCSDGFAPASDGACTLVGGRACEQAGESAAICSPNNALLAGGRNSSRLCAHYTGDLSILQSCFEPDHYSASHGNRVLTVDDLYFYLSRLSVIRGSVTVILNRPDNLTFLAGLRKIFKRPGRPNDGSIAIRSQSLSFLGLASLKHLDGTLSLAPPKVRCPGLLPTQLAVKHRLVVLNANSSNSASLDNVRRASRGGASDCPRCHAECDPDYGCWGPGPDCCVRCLHHRLPGDLAAGRPSVCVASCDGAGGWYNAGRLTNASASGIPMITESRCSRCHQLCHRCTAPGPLDCTDCSPDAFTEVESGRCVPACSTVGHFADTDRVCRPCPKACLPAVAAGIQDEPTCTGNLSIVGPGGCSFCSKVVEPDPEAEANFVNTTLCIPPLAPCPSGMRLQMLEADDADRHFAWRRRRPHNLVSVCRRTVSVGVDIREQESAEDELQKRRSVRDVRLTVVYFGFGILAVFVLLLTVACLWMRHRTSRAAAAATAAAAAGKSDDSQRRMMIDSAWDEDTEPLNAADGSSCLGAELGGIVGVEADGIAVLRTISEKELTRGAEIGSGAFGTVYRGEWHPDAAAPGQPRGRLSVAIKILADSSDCGGSCLSGELLAEGRIMASVRHQHCLSLVGVCMTQPPQLISRFLPLGNLRDFLRARRGTGQLGSSHLLRFAAQIASGMAYLEQRSVIHRDLACRNVLVASARCVKITDFGLARLMENPNEEYCASGGKLPIKWLALECLISRRFSHKSDVWAYGVTLWEIFMFGEPPYASVKPVDLADYLEKGERLPQPQICTLDVYILMIKCWMLNEAQRPSFEELESSFRKMCLAPGRYVYIKGDKFSSSVNSATAQKAGSSDSTPTGSGSSSSQQDANLASDDGGGAGGGGGGGEYSPLEVNEVNEEGTDEVFRTAQPQPEAADADDADAASYINAVVARAGSVKLKLGCSPGIQDSRYTKQPRYCGQELQPLLQSDGYLEPISLRRPSNTASVHNPEYFFSASRSPQTPLPPTPPTPPPGMLASLAQDTEPLSSCV